MIGAFLLVHAGWFGILLSYRLASETLLNRQRARDLFYWLESAFGVFMLASGTFLIMLAGKELLQ